MKRNMIDYKSEALKRVRENAEAKSLEHHAFVEDFCKPYGVDIDKLLKSILQRPVTINFHPDRFSNNGKTIIENLIEQGQYHGQFRTGTTNGGRSAYIGGDRFTWEQRIFFDAYPRDILDRPKYGALNLFNHIDGASVRFGSCFFSLKREAINRCTFAYGDSHQNPTTLCTSDTFVGILAEIFGEFLNKERILNRVLDPASTSKTEVLAILLNSCNELKDLGRNLDYCIETHIHGDVHLESDIDNFYVDASFQNTAIGTQAEALCKKYGITLGWIPKRQIDADSIGGLFRGHKIPILVQKIEAILGRQGYINAEIIGQASRDSVLHPETWEDMGSEPELFQYLKQLWHTVGYFG
jgi:hypothetical protein